MSKSVVKIAVVVGVILVLLFLGRLFYYTPEPVIGPESLEQSSQHEQVDDGRLGIREELEKRREGRSKRSAGSVERIPESLAGSELNLESERLYRRALLEGKIAMERTGDYERMVGYCRQLLKEYPDSSQAVEVKKLLGQMPLEEREKYNITEEETGPN